ncbi:MAG: putative NRPS-like protein biosynthetic cluster [Cirrosporium novae-zelandiae]|nr:MAG: putative NRPS-like protein biosynthetic cluster [Cirrosporium novae-zelandiae]
MLSVIPPPTEQPHTHFVPEVPVNPVPIPKVTQPNPQPLTVEELIQDRLNLDIQPVISYPSSGIEYVDCPINQLDTFAFRVAKKYAQYIPPRCSSSEKPVVIALLGPSTLDYLVTMLALAKLGHTVLYLSTRISKEAHENLLQLTGSSNIFIHPSFRKLATSLQKDLPELEVYEIAEQNSYHYDIGQILSDTRLTKGLDPEQETGNVAYIIHSSGSTGLPKPVFLTHRAVINNYSQNVNMRGFITLPLYHGHGICSLFRTVYSCKSLHLYNASLPLTKQYLVDTMRAHDFEVFYGVPYALKLLAESEEGIELLAKFKIVMFGGSPCPDSLGNKLVARGVNLVSHYGTTETGQLMTSFRPPGDEQWDWVRPNPRVKPYLRFEERGDGLYELINLDGWPSKVTMNRPDGSYATKDLFKKHPTIEAYKYYARLDDTIVLVNGEKAIPLQMEGAIRNNGLVAEAVVFGSGKASLGLMLIPSQDAEGLSKVEILNAVWPSVEIANEAMPAYAKISRDMIICLPVGTKYPVTDKGTVIRQAFYCHFEQEIECSYEEKDEGDLDLSELELRDFIRTQMQEIIPLDDPSQLTDDTDFFSLGMDSLQSTRLRAVLFKNLDLKGQKLGLNVVFDYPTIRLLAKNIDSIRAGVTTERESVEDEMRALIEKYSSFKKHIPGLEGPEGQYILVTGATGSLGAHTIAHLATIPSVKEIYCPIRATTPSAAQARLHASLRTRNLILSPTSLSKLHPFPAALTSPTLSLPPETHTHLTTHLTHILHLAWSVNFNLHLLSFSDCLLTTQNLIGLCLSSRRPAPATFTFCSSTSTSTRTPPDAIITEALPTSFTHAQKMGYAQSKLVAENICHRAATQNPNLPINVARVGQIIGDTKSGIWNPRESIPMMLQTARTIHALPKLDEEIRWLPVDIVAKGLVEISLNGPPPSSDNATTTTIPEPNLPNTFNILNPHPLHWTRDLLPLLRTTTPSLPAFEKVSTMEWLERLRGSDPDPERNPPVRLLKFFEGRYGGEWVGGEGEGGCMDDDGEVGGKMGIIKVFNKWETRKAQAWSEALREVAMVEGGVVGSAVLGRIVGYLIGVWDAEEEEKMRKKEIS